MSAPIEIVSFSENDWSEIAAIYQEGIATGIATFETKVPSWQDWDASHIKPCRFKAMKENQVMGWAALSPTSKRKVYQGVAEVSIYITSKFRNLGIGKLLLSRLIDESEAQGFWTLQAGIFRQNKASIALHKAVGFREIGYREKVGRLNGVWHDNTILERRSKLIL
ncbi:N-acetyltransferase family protein [Aquimarina sp. D1M17]|uniref:GNAT family N-acetyltransferase n=1 Tax=Aquimarina acroporae TaxID=2937283 RepID=UPI0020BE77A2|nr:GNAT family N-acetyltransferase [Aquimarina acroporae]MCK8523791.1 N-acetyltransferase family protein [Aquimarina acroporae]